MMAQRWNFGEHTRGIESSPDTNYFCLQQWTGQSSRETGSCPDKATNPSYNESHTRLPFQLQPQDPHKMEQSGLKCGIADKCATIHTYICGV